MKNLRTVLCTALLTALAPPSMAHGGEDHGSTPTPHPPGMALPRAAAQTQDFELVAVLDGQKLTLTVDRFATNAPVVDAEVEITSGSVQTVAAQAAPGVYAIAGAPFAQPGKYLLAISVQAGETADLLTLTLEIAGQGTGAAPVGTRTPWAVAGFAGTLLLAVAGLLTWQRRKKSAAQHRESTQ